MEEAILQAKNVSYAYEEGEGLAISDINLSFRRGEMTAILGHNGSGKSTLAKLLNGLYIPTAGTVTVCGMDTALDDNTWEIRKKAGMVFQNPDNQLVASIVRDDVAFGLENIGVPTEEMPARIEAALKAVGMLDFIDRAPHMLSGGQKQRIAIAGILAMQPQTLVLDEPAAGLDPKGRDQILSIIREMHDQGKTILMVSHSMDDIADLATRIVVMQDGTILAEGSPRDIFSQEDIIQQAGLSVPEAAQLCRKLRAHGLDIPANLYTHSEVRDAIIRLWKEQNHAQ